MSLHQMLAKMSSGEQRRQNFDSEFFLPHQRGKVLITGLKTISKNLKTSVILEGKVLESKITKEGAVSQPEGTKVKKVYSLSKFEFHQQMMMNDLLDIAGFTGKEDPKELETYFKGALDDGALVGVVTAFKTEQNTHNKKTGVVRDTPITEVHFSALEAENDGVEVEKRKAEILGK